MDIDIKELDQHIRALSASHNDELVNDLMVLRDKCQNASSHGKSVDALINDCLKQVSSLKDKNAGKVAAEINNVAVFLQAGLQRIELDRQKQLENDLQQVRKDIEQDKKEDRMQSTLPSMTVLMAHKRENRLCKGKVFNGFVMNKEGFEEFITQLKQAATTIPPGTRMQLAVGTSLGAPYYHWAAIDILVGENGHISTFLLDAANAREYRQLHAELKNTFTSGNHYIFEGDMVMVRGEKKKRAIQHAPYGCGTFTLEHLRQLSQLDSDCVYARELPFLSAKTQNKSDIHPGEFTGGLKLSRIFRSMQTVSGFGTLPDEVKNTVIKEGQVPLTLGRSVQNSTVEGQNKLISKKMERYKREKETYFTAMPEYMKKMIMQQREGFVYIANPMLFQLQSALAAATIDHLRTFINEFSLQLQEFFPDADVKAEIAELKSLLHSTNLGAARNAIMYLSGSLFHKLYENNENINRMMLALLVRYSLPRLAGQSSLLTISPGENLPAKLITEDRIRQPDDLYLLLKSIKDKKYPSDIVVPYVIKKLNQFITARSDLPEIAKMLGMIASTAELAAILKGLDSSNSAALMAPALKMDNPGLCIALLSDKSNSKIMLHVATKANALNTMLSLIINGADLNAQDPVDGNTALHIAVAENNAKAATLLLNAEAQVNIKNTADGMTPLHMAVKKGAHEMITTLLDHGASIHEKDNNNLSAMQYAILQGDEQLFTLLVSRQVPLPVEAQMEALQYAIKIDSSIMARRVLDTYPKLLTSMNASGLSPLHEAIKGVKIDIFEMLLKRGADLTAADKQGKNALRYLEDMNMSDMHNFVSRAYTTLRSRASGNTTAAAMLIEKLDPTGNDIVKTALLTRAMVFSNVKNVSLLMDKNADPTKALGNTNPIKEMARFIQNIEPMDENTNEVLLLLEKRMDFSRINAVLANADPVNDNVIPVLFLIALRKNDSKLIQDILQRCKDSLASKYYEDTLLPEFHPVFIDYKYRLLKISFLT